MTAMPSTEQVISLRGVHKRYPGGVHALRGVDLDVNAGEMLAIVGPSGSGKSTMLHIVGTLDLPTEGSVHLAGHDISHLNDRELSGLRARTIGFVFQQFFLLSGTSALDNVATGAVYTGLPPRERRARAAAALDRVGLGHRVDHHPNELSGGERQRVAVARALINDPQLILADEPTGNLDSKTEAQIIDLLQHLHDEGTGVLVITHSHEIAATMPRQVSLHDGRIVADTAGRHVGAPA
ncbi:MAG TPA: ABC transporter ATP-binding protein [Egibacteraceae bacterium]|nr:ABC transporter ATP-binding protein [Egibacteraceae bacterium]